MDGTERLCKLLYGNEDAEKYIAGSDAQMLHDAADAIEGCKSKALIELGKKIADVSKQHESYKKEKTHPETLGSYLCNDPDIYELLVKIGNQSLSK